MASRTAGNSLTDLMAVSLENKLANIADQLTDVSPFFNELKKKGYFKADSKGAEGVTVIARSGANTVTRSTDITSGILALPTTHVDNYDNLFFDWAEYNCRAVVNKTEYRMAQPAGKVDLIEAASENCVKDLINAMSDDMVSTQAVSGGILGLGDLITTAYNTGTIGGIARSSNAWARNKIISAAGRSITPSASTIEQLMHLMFTKLHRDNEMPELIVMSSDYFAFFAAATAGREQYNGGAGDSNGIRKFRGATVIEDSNLSSGLAYFFCPNSFEIRYAKNAWMAKEHDKPLHMIDQNAVISGVGAIWTPVVLRPSRTGVLTSASVTEE